MWMKNSNYTIENRTRDLSGGIAVAWTNCPTACTPSQFLHLAVHAHSTKEIYSLLTAFGLSLTVFRDVCYIRFVPTVLLDLSCYRLKSLTVVRVSLIKPCLCIQGRCIYTEGPRTPHTAYFYFKSITHRESRCEQRSERRVIFQSSWSEGVRLEIVERDPFCFLFFCL